MSIPPLTDDSKTAKCIKCGAAIAPTAKFCLECGTAQANAAPASIKCIACGTEIPGFASFCSECGAERTASPPSSPERVGKPMKCRKCGAEAPPEWTLPICAACCVPTVKRNYGPLLLFGTVVVFFLVIVGIIISNGSSPTPPESPKVIAAQEAYNRAVKRVEDEADAGKVPMDGLVDRMSREGNKAYREAMNAPENTAPVTPVAAPEEPTIFIPPYKTLNIKKPTNGSCVVDIQLPHEMEEPELIQISQALREHECAGLVPILLEFYLPKMKVDGGSWANAQYDPSSTGPIFDVQITGLKAKVIAKVRAYKSPLGEQLIGSWENDSNGSVYRIVQDSDSYFEERSSNPSLRPARQELKEIPAKSGRRFQVVGSESGDYDVISPDGTLRAYDREGFIKEFPKLKQ